MRANFHSSWKSLDRCVGRPFAGERAVGRTRNPGDGLTTPIGPPSSTTAKRHFTDVGSLCLVAHGSQHVRQSAALAGRETYLRQRQDGWLMELFEGVGETSGCGGENGEFSLTSLPADWGDGRELPSFARAGECHIHEHADDRRYAGLGIRPQPELPTRPVQLSPDRIRLGAAGGRSVLRLRRRGAVNPGGSYSSTSYASPQIPRRSVSDTVSPGSELARVAPPMPALLRTDAAGSRTTHTPDRTPTQPAVEGKILV